MHIENPLLLTVKYDVALDNVWISSSAYTFESELWYGIKIRYLSVSLLWLLFASHTIPT